MRNAGRVNIEDPDSSGINYKAHRNPRLIVQMKRKPHSKGAASQMPPKGETIKRPMQPSEGSIVNNQGMTRLAPV